MESEIKPPTGKPASELPDQIEAKSTLDDERTLTACKELTQLSELGVVDFSLAGHCTPLLQSRRHLYVTPWITAAPSGDLESRINCTSEEKETVPSIFTTRTIKSVRDCTTNISKGKTLTTSSAGTSSYTPHRGPLGKFIDTTKLSDRQYEIALFEGLIKTSLRSPVPRMLSCYCYEEEHDIPHIKKNLNID
ncbi:hypothetical protein KIN20_015496 [Parelaphostrongylus tenuis]|uniref:Uncharacterized protein n=1 Tax=Parelaphostrongylus tenuis TaxID=148309 RepID=A0AAD5MF01_PARTN|nr:hypothetical protein KIN20_015496 [Parelaphostrongylus tenuis]